MRKVSQAELDSLRLIVKSKNEPGKPPFIEEIPKILWGRAPREVKGNKWFVEAANRRTAPMFGKKHMCEFCFCVPERPERHETYGLYLLGADYVIKLEDIIWCCPECHQGVHHGNAIRRAMQSGMSLPVLFPRSDAYTKYAWQKAKYLLIDDELYLIEDLKRADYAYQKR